MVQGAAVGSGSLLNEVWPRQECMPGVLMQSGRRRPLGSMQSKSGGGRGSLDHTSDMLGVAAVYELAYSHTLHMDMDADAGQGK